MNAVQEWGWKAEVYANLGSPAMRWDTKGGGGRDRGSHGDRQRERV